MAMGKTKFRVGLFSGLTAEEEQNCEERLCKTKFVWMERNNLERREGEHRGRVTVGGWRWKGGRREEISNNLREYGEELLLWLGLG